MKTFLLIFIAALSVSVFAADPAQPKVGQTPVINATNGYGGTLTVRTQLNVGFTGETPLLDLTSANGTYTATFSIDDSGNVTMSNTVSGLLMTISIDGQVTFESDNSTGFVQSTSGTGTSTIFSSGALSLTSLFPNGVVTLNPGAPTNSSPFNFEDSSDLGPDGNVMVVSSGSGGVFQFIGNGKVLVTDGATTNLFVDSPSGYTGAGTLFLSDDGTYKSAGGGDTIWTNDNGTITATSTATNGLPGFVMDTPVHVDGDSFRFQMGGTNMMTLNVASGLDVWGPYSYMEVNSYDQTSYLDMTWLEMIMTINGLTRVDINPGQVDGLTPFIFRSDVAHTSGNMFELGNQTTKLVTVDINGFVDVEANSSGGIFLNNTDSANTFADFDASVIDMYVANTVRVKIDPTAADGTTPYVNDTSIAHTSGNLMEISNHGTNKITGTWDGVVNAVGGFGSIATDSAVTIAATGWTNTFGKNAQIMMDGVALVYKVADAAGTFWYTNGTALSGESFTLQTGGKFIITSGTLNVGRAKPW